MAAKGLVLYLGGAFTGRTAPRFFGTVSKQQSVDGRGPLRAVISGQMISNCRIINKPGGGIGILCKTRDAHFDRFSYLR
jgi:hypothetical protein